MACGSSARKSSYVFEYRISFLGAEKVGKTALINQIANKMFTECYDPTVSNHLTHVVDYEGHLCVCLLVDTSGCYDFPAMRKLAVSKGNAFVVVYSVDDRESFERAKGLIKEIQFLKRSSEEIRIVLVGNKSDLPHSVSYNEALNYALSIHEGNTISTFVEASAKERDSTVEIMYKILRMFLPPVTPIEEYKDQDQKPLRNKPVSPIHKFGSMSRRTSKSLIQRKSNERKELAKTLSDSEEESMVSSAPPRSPTAIMASFRKQRSKSTSSIKTPAEKTSERRRYFPTTSLRRGSLSPCLSPKISEPKLLSHSMTLNRYNLKLNLSPSLTSVSSNDSGLSEGSLKGDDEIQALPISRTASLPITAQGISMQRKKSISERMKGMFKRSKFSFSDYES